MPAWIRLYGRLLGFLRPHLAPLSGAVLFMALYAALASFSLALVVPFTQIVLQGDLGGSPTATAPDTSSATTPATTPGTAPGSTAQTATRVTDALGGYDLRQQIETRFYQLVHGRDRTETMRRFALALLAVFLMKNLCWYAQSFLVVRVEQNVIRDIRERLFAHTQRLSFDYFAQQHSGALISRLTNDIELIKGAIANGIADLLRQSLLLLAYLVTVLIANWQLFLFAVAVLPPNLWLIDRLGGTLRRSTRFSQARLGRLTAVLSETFAGMRVVKAFGLEEERSRRFAEEARGFAKIMIRMTRIGSLSTPLTEMLGVLVAVGILWFAGATMVSEGGQDSGRFLLFIVGMLSMMQPIKALSQVNVKIQQGLGAAERIFEVLDAKPSVVDPVSPRPLTTLEREIRYENVAFAYREGTPVLHGVDLTVTRGQVLALVGPSGGGKSTLVDLLPRFYDPLAGRITLDGHDIREYRLADLRALLGFVTQETILFEGTVRQNIRLGLLEASDEDVEVAARTANAHEFISRLPEGYDTAIGERGTRLSGGQRQRLAIARAVLRNPEVLIFDEATSALDTESESLVQEAIERLLENRTAIVIAHRLSTVRHADRIAVIAEGRVAQLGSHETLMTEGGLYRRLYEMQFRERDGESVQTSISTPTVVREGD